MGATRAFTREKKSGLFLPAPRVELQEYSYSSSVNTVYDGSPTGLGVTMVRCPQVTAMEIPQEFYKPEYDLRVELMRYKRGSRESRWTHPTCEITQPLGSKFRSGAHHNTLLGFERQSEWTITNEAQKIVFDNLQKFFIIRPVTYRLGVGNYGTLDVAMPSYKNSHYTSMSQNCKWHYASGYTPNYFAWRYSILDTTAEKYRRLTGPMSKMVSITHEDMPFMFDAATSQAEGVRCASINPRFNITRLLCMFETRLP